MLRASELAERALGLQPDPSLPAWEGQLSTCCSHCAIDIHQGEPYATYSAGAFFSDTRDLAQPNGLVCWRCFHLRKKVLMDGLGASVITEDNVYSISKDVEKAWLFLNPPKPPFVAVHKSSNTQHLVWRTPVTLDKGLITVRFGPELLQVQTGKVAQAIEVAKSLKERNGGKWLAPMILLRGSLDPVHGKINPKASALLDDDELAVFQGLGRGERWALTYLMHSKLPEPCEPNSIKDFVLTKLNK